MPDRESKGVRQLPVYQSDQRLREPQIPRWYAGNCEQKLARCAQRAVIYILKMTSGELIDLIVEKMPRHEALESFVAACNRRDTLFITERWFAPRKQRLLALLSDPITADEACVLQELAWQRISFEAVFDWLAALRGWDSYQVQHREKRMARSLGLNP